eukprot:1364239-Prymnesium_polylepis.1
MVDFGMPDLLDLSTSRASPRPRSPRSSSCPPARASRRSRSPSRRASLPINLTLVLENALDGEPHLLEPVDDRMIALHKHRQARPSRSRRLHAAEPPRAPPRDGGGVRQD